MIDKINKLLGDIEELKASNVQELEDLRIKFLSKKGSVSALMDDFRNVAAEEKKNIGMKLNELKTKAQDRINQLKENLENSSSSEESIDLTRTAYPVELGTRHPLSLVK